MAGSETLELIVNLKGDAKSGLKELGKDIKDASDKGTESLHKLSAEIKAAMKIPPSAEGIANLKKLSQEINAALAKPSSIPKTAEEIQKLKNEINDTAAAAARMKSPMDSLASSVRGLMAAVGISLSFAAIISAVKSVITVFGEFEDVMSKVKVVTRATDAEFIQLSEQAKQMGMTTVVSATDAAKTLLALGHAGLSASDAMKALPHVITLSSAGMVSLGDAVEISTTAMTNYGLTAEWLPSVNNVLVRTVKATGIEMSNLSAALTTTAPIARSMGVEFEDLSAAIGTLHSAGIRGAAATFTLKGVMDTLINPTSEEAELLLKLGDRIGGAGLKIRDAQGYFVGFASIVQQLEKAGISGGEAMRLFGMRAGPGMAALVNQGSQKLNELNSNLRELTDVTTKQASDLDTGLNGALKRLSNSFEAVKIAIGDAFSEDLQKLIIAARDRIIEIVGEIKRLKDNGSLEAWAASVKRAFEDLYPTVMVLVTGFGQLIHLGQAAINTARAAAAVKEGTLRASDAATMGYTELNEALRKIDENKAVAKLNLEMKDLNEQIQQTTKELVLAEEGSWAKLGIVGGLAKDQQEEYIDAQKKKLKELQDRWQALGNEVLDIAQKVNKVDLLPTPKEQDDYFARSGRGAAGGEGASTLRNIGRGTAPPAPSPVVETEAQKKARIAAGKAAVAESMANQKVLNSLLENSYREAMIYFEKDINQKLILTGQYYDQQAASIQKSSDIEIAALEALAAKARVGSEERIKLDSEIVIKRQETTSRLIELETKRFEEEYRLAEEAKRKREELEGLKIDAANRIEAGQIDNPFERQQKAEELALDEKQRREMEALKKLTNDEALIRDTARAQELEKQRLHEEQVMALRNFQLENAKQVFGGISELMTAMYEASGKKTKAFFYIAKAAAMAEAIINIAQGVTKALGQGGYYGVIMGATVAAAGAVQLAKIASQQMASGGIVGGKSPSPRADDKIIAVTSGEYVHPVNAVRHYGVGFMNAVRNMQFPVDLAARFSSNYPLTSSAKRSFAEGGGISVGSGSTTGKSADKAITINNILDPNLFAQYLASSPGQRQLVNVITANAPAVRTAVFAR